MQQNQGGAAPPSAGAGGDMDGGMSGVVGDPDIVNDDAMQEIKSDILPQQTKEEIMDIFSVFDRENTGTVPQSKLRKMLRALNLNPNEQEYEAYLQQINPDSRPNFIRIEDISRILEKRTKDADSIDDVIEALKMFDKDNDGKITVREMRYAMGNMGNAMNQEELEEFISAAQSDDQFILIEDFAKMLTGK